MSDMFGSVEKLLPTTVVGRYPQPDWLVRRCWAPGSRRGSGRSRSGALLLADESPIKEVDTVVARIRNVLQFVDLDRLILAPDCGMKHLPREEL